MLSAPEKGHWPSETYVINGIVNWVWKLYSSDIFRHKSNAGLTKTINFADITWQDKSNVSWDSSRESMSVKDVLRVIGSVWV